MDYLKFLGLSFLAIFLIGIEARLAGPGLGTFVAAGATIGFFALYAPKRHAIAYVAWLVLLLGWIVLLGNSVKAMVAQHPENVARLRVGEGLLLLLAIVLLNPLCYGIGWLVTRSGPAPVAANVPGTRRRKARLLLTFCVAVLLALLAGEVAESLLRLPAKPFAVYLVLGSLLVGAIAAVFASRRQA